MPVKLDEYDGVGVLTLGGDFSGEDVQAARKCIEEAVTDRKVKDFVVDLEKASFVDSEGLEALLWMHGRCEDSFGHLKLAAADEAIRKILEVTRLSRRFDIASDVPTALKLMR